MESKVIYVTSYMPFGHGEVWGIREALALLDAGVDITIVPRSASGNVLHREASKLLSHTLSAPLLNRQILTAFLRTALGRPALLSELISWTAQQSNTVNDFVKGMVVLPKSLYLAEKLQGMGGAHVHAFGTSTVAVLAYVLSRILGVTWSFTLHASSILRPSHRRSFDAHMKSARFARVISRRVATELLAFMGEPYAEKIKMIHLGTDCSLDPSAVPEDRDLFVIVTPAALLPQKGHQFAVVASRLLVDRGVNNFKWYFYGNGRLEEALASQIRSLGLENQIALAGIIDNADLMNLYRTQQVNVVVLPSVDTQGIPEGIPVSLMEAMACGVPVVATDCGGTTELVVDGAGLIVPQRDGAALADAIERLLTHSAFRQTLVQRGRAVVVENFNASRIAQELKVVFAEKA